MAQNRIQIKRSTANATVTGLNPGELAFTANGNVLFIGNPADGASVRIAGLQTPGTLTANQALVANSTSGIDKVITANAVVTTLWANGSAGSSDDILFSNGSVVYWRPSSSISINTAAAYTWTNTHTFNAAINANTVNATSFTTSGVTTNTTGVFATGTVNAAVHSIGTTFIANTLGVYHTGTVNAASHTVGTATVANATGVFTTGTVNGSILSVGSNFTANTTRVVIGSGVALQANGGIGTAGQVLHSNGTSVYWDVDDQGVTSVATGNGLTGGTISTTGTISVLANNGITANSTGLFVTAANGVSVTAAGVNVLAGTNGGLVSNSTGVFVTAGNGLLTNATGLHVGSGNGISVSADALAVQGGSTLTVNATGVHVNNTLSITDLSLSGNLTVLGTLSTIDTENLTVKDSLIELANGNVAADLLDIGLYGQYAATGTRYTGIFRDATDGVYKLFANSTVEPTTTVDTAATGYVQATLQAFLNSGGLISNATNVAITANSTVGVAITANTLTLTTALAGTSGGTGRSTTTSQALLVGNTTNGYDLLALNTNAGYVLQSNGTALVYDWLDGGTF